MSKVIHGDTTKNSTGSEGAIEEVEHIIKKNALGYNAMITTQRVEEIQAHAYEEGFALGKQEGIDAGNLQVQQQVQKLNSIMNYLAQPLVNLDNQVEQEVLSLVVVLVKQLIRREIKTDSGQIIAVIKESLSQLPVSARNIQLHLHPDDVALVKEMMAVSSEDHNWNLIDDPVISQGGCKVVTDTSQIDATLEARLHATIANVLGSQRNTD